MNVNPEYIELSFDNVTKEKAKSITDESCRKLLVNPNTETYRFELEEWQWNLLF